MVGGQTLSLKACHRTPVGTGGELVVVVAQSGFTFKNFKHLVCVVTPVSGAMQGSPRSKSAGGKAQAVTITDEMLGLVDVVRPKLNADGMFLVGLDIVGDKLMEINVFSPGGLGSAQQLEGVDFAPVIDVSDQGADTVIGDRSFSSNPVTVTKYGRAFAAGLRDAGVLPVFKHFPGHGHGSGDSHTGTVRTPPLSDLATNDLVPFRTLLKMPGVAAMVGHMIVPGLTGPELPASVNPKAIGMLRTGRGYNGPAFHGVIFSDDLSGMAAISEKYPIEQAVPMALAAGSDIALWLTTDKVSVVLDALEKAVAGGRLSMAQVDAAVTRILRAKRLERC